MLPHSTHRLPRRRVYSVTGGWHKTYRIADTDESKRTISISLENVHLG
jgi:hypothetical protein